jgi:hypothetical protein
VLHVVRAADEIVNHSEGTWSIGSREKKPILIPILMAATYARLRVWDGSAKVTKIASEVFKEGWVAAAPKGAEAKGAEATILEPLVLLSNPPCCGLGLNPISIHVGTVQGGLENHTILLGEQKWQRP